MFPYYVSGKIIAGFGRGSTELGFPTANFEEDVVEKLPSEVQCGIYCGWASVDNGPVYKMVMSVGFNPFYGNTKKTMETHILHTFGTQLHGQLLKVCMLDYIRPEANFNSVEELKDAIRNDIKIAEAKLDSPSFSKYQKDSFFAVLETS